MKPRLWMVLTWVGILVVVVTTAALYGGRDCQVPKTGIFHSLLKNQRFVPTGARRSFACRRVK